jgi:spermidine synthase
MSTADPHVSIVFGDSSTDIFVTSTAEPKGTLRTMLKRVGPGDCKEASNVLCDRVEEDASPARGRRLGAGPTRAPAASSGADLSACSARRCLFDSTNVDLPDALFRTMAAGAFAQIRTVPDVKNTTDGVIPTVFNIGHGAGALPLWLLRVFDVRVESVDFDPTVIRAAPCFGLFPNPALRLTVADGRAALAQRPAGSCAVIFVDVFAPPRPDSPAETPGCFRTLEFFELAYAKLTDGGRVVMNVWPNYLPDVVPAAVSAVTAGGGHVYIGEVPPPFSNTVLVATKRPGKDAKPWEWRLPSAEDTTAEWYKQATWTRVQITEGDVVPRDADLCTNVQRDVPTQTFL